jgi:hypothetical protein
MQSDWLDGLDARHAVFVTTAIQMQHPRNDYERWRHAWAELSIGNLAGSGGLVGRRGSMDRCRAADLPAVRSST